MLQLRTAVKLTFALLAIWLGLVWAGLLPRPAFLPSELEIEPLTYLLSAVAAALFIFWKNNDAKSVGVTDSHPDTNLETEIKKYLKSRYEHRIRQKLAGREPVNLRKIPSSTGTSDEGAQNFITLPAEKVPSGMAELFDEARGRLLVVGAPGAGKTTLLLQLALALLERAQKPVAHLEGVPQVAPAIPVLLNLATWRSEFADFDDWLQRILPLELGASKALAEKIRRNTPIILLLDGLDEVPEDARASCLRAIGEYGAEAKHRFVISSRLTEYAATQDAPVYLEVEVQPLTPQQVIDNLTAYVFHQPEAKPLLNALQTDSLLREAVANPFYLNTAQLLFATGHKYSDFGFTATDIAGRQRELVERFVEDALGRKVKRDYPKEKARKWLGFLAGKMEKVGKAGFELADIKPWWGNRWLQIFLYLILFSPFWYLIAGVVRTTVFSLTYWETESILQNVFLTGISISIVVIIISIMVDIPHKSRELLNWSQRNFKSGWVLRSLRYFVYSHIIGSFFFFFVMAIVMADNDKNIFSDSLQIKFIIALCSRFGLGCAIIFGFFALIKEGITTTGFLKINTPYQRFFSALAKLDFWIFLHVTFRLALYFQGFLPLRLVTFLNEMSLRHLLEFDGDPETGKGGGSWSWRHRIIQEYFLEK